MSLAYQFYSQVNGALQSAILTLADSTGLLLPLNTPAGTTAVVAGPYNPATQRYDLTLQQIVNRDPTPVTAIVNTTSVILSGVPMGALMTIGGNASYSVNNTNPAGQVTLNFALPGTYTVAVACFPSVDYATSFLLPPAVAPQSGALALTATGPTLFPARITIPAGGLVVQSTGLAVPVSALMPKAATALAFSGIAPVVVTSHVASTAALALAGGAATATITLIGVVSKATYPMAITAYAPVIAGFVTPATGALSVFGVTASVLQDFPMAPATGALLMEISLTVPSGALTIASDPQIVARKLITTTTGAFTVSTVSPALKGDFPIFTVTGTLTLLPIDGPLMVHTFTPAVAALAFAPVGVVEWVAVVPKPAALGMVTSPVFVPGAAALAITGN